MNDLLVLLVRPSTGVLPPHVLRQLARAETWHSLSPIIARYGLGALVYERLQDQPARPPHDIGEWLEAEHRQTASRNAVLLTVLKEIRHLLLSRGVPMLLFKGPVLGHLGAGLFVRPFLDLDILIRPRDAGTATTALKSAGFAEESGTAQHHVLVRPEPPIPAIVEVHVDLFDRDRHYLPDVRSIWERRIDLEIHGQVIAVPSLTDHLLLAMMQLPHHHWNPRLLVDVATIVDRWGDTIEWPELLRRANDWGLRALAGSSLHTIGSVLGVPLPEAARTSIEAEGYFRRVQWRVVRRTAQEQFGGGGNTICAIAPLVVLDRFRDMVSLMAKTAAHRDGGSGSGGATPSGLRRIMTGASSLPSIVSLLGEAAKGIPTSALLQSSLRSPGGRKLEPRITGPHH